MGVPLDRVTPLETTKKVTVSEDPKNDPLCKTHEDVEELDQEIDDAYDDIKAWLAMHRRRSHKHKPKPTEVDAPAVEAEEKDEEWKDKEKKDEEAGKDEGTDEDLVADDGDEKSKA